MIVRIDINAFNELSIISDYIIIYNKMCETRIVSKIDTFLYLRPS